MMQVFKLVHIAHRLDRIAILPDLEPIHIDGGSAIPYRQFFDLDSFSFASAVKITEWSQVKLQSSNELSQNETLSCWGSRGSTNGLDARYRIEMTYVAFPEELVHFSRLRHAIGFAAIEILAAFDSKPRLQVNESTDDPNFLCFAHLFYETDFQFVNGVVDDQYSIEELAPNGAIWHGQYTFEFQIYLPAKLQ